MINENNNGNMPEGLKVHKKALDLDNTHEAYSEVKTESFVKPSEEKYNGSIFEDFSTGKLSIKDIIKKKDEGTLVYLKEHYKLLKKTIAEQNEEIKTLKGQTIANKLALDGIVDLYDETLGKNFNDEEWGNNFEEIIKKTFEMAAYSKKPFEIITNTKDTINNYSAELNKSIDILILKHEEVIKIKTNIPDTEKFYEITGNFETDVKDKLFTKPVNAYTKMNLTTMLNHIQQELKPAESKKLSEWVNGELLRSHNLLIERIETHVKTVYKTAIETIPEVFIELKTLYSMDTANKKPMTYLVKGQEKEVSSGLIELVTDYSQKYFNHVMKEDIGRLERLESQKEVILKEANFNDKINPILNTLKKGYKIEATQMLNSANPVIKTITESTNLPFEYGKKFIDRINQLYNMNY